MSLIQISDLTFAYEGSYDNVFDHVNVHMDTDWRLGLVGRNGRGKTTLLRLMMGDYPYSGSISAKVSFAYFPYHVPGQERETGAVLKELCPSCEDWELLRELSLLDVSEEVLHRPFASLSGGEQSKILLAALFLTENRFLLIDEPTNHLDSKARDDVAAYLKRKRGFILVSHDRDLLDTCVDHILAINKSNIEVINGNYSTWQIQSARQEQFEKAEQEKLHREVDRLTDAAKRTANWSDQVEKSKKGTRNSGLRPDRGYLGHKAAKMMKRSKAAEDRKQKAVEDASMLLKNLEHKQDLKLHPLDHHARTIVELRNLAVSYDGEEIMQPLDMTVERGDRIVLAGKNGSGKSSLLKLLKGEAIAYSGQMEKASQLIISYVSQESGGLSGALDGYARVSGVDETLFLTILRKLGFDRVQFEKDLSDLSEGQKKKVLIARSLCEKAHLYLWDEPLNYIDIPSRLQIEELLLTYRPTLVFVEHDGAFCRAVGTKEVRVQRR